MTPEEKEVKEQVLRPWEDVFDITALDKDEENEWQEVFRGRSRTSSSRLPTSAPTPRGWEWIEQRQARAHHDGSGAAESVILLDMLQEVPTMSGHHQGRAQRRTTSPPAAGGCRASARSTLSSERATA